MKRSLLVCLAICLITGVTAGTAMAQPTREQYIAQADPVCAQSIQVQLNALGGVVTDIKHRRFKKAAKKFRRTAGLLSSGIDQVAAIEPPPEDVALISAWITALRREVPIIKRFASALRKGNLGKLAKSNRQLQRAASAAPGLVQGYGFQACDSLGA
jgi:hypothetical protein